MKLQIVQYGVIIILLLVIIILIAAAMDFNRSQPTVNPTLYVDKTFNLTKTAISITNDAMETVIYQTKESP